MSYYVISYGSDYEHRGRVNIDLVDEKSIDAAIGREGNLADIFRHIVIYALELDGREYLRYFGESFRTVDERASLFKVNIADTTLDGYGHYFDRHLGSRVSTEEADVLPLHGMLKFEVAEKIDDGRTHSVKEAVRNLLSYHPIEPIDIEEVRNWWKKKTSGSKDFTFKVHNVGQGLATSIARAECVPFFFFDYGLGTRQNAHTIPPVVNLDMEEESVIVLSHLHDDHWCGTNVNPHALSATWIVPNQVRFLRFNNFAQSIWDNGGRVLEYDDTLAVGPVVVDHDCTGTYVGKHITGFGMRINAFRPGAETHGFNIYVGGDQNYNRQKNALMQNLDILVAAHHGGSYGPNSGIGRITSKTDSLIIYSYGIGNSHGHPSRVADYHGWGARFDTATGGDYAIAICFV